MIFYFSGTGNSYHAARLIAEAQKEELVSIAAEFDKKDNTFEYFVNDDDLVGFVYPVHAWGPPEIVLDFIKKITISSGIPYVFSLCTCGADEGLTTKILEKALNKRGIPLDNAFTVKMPDNYIIGFDTEREEILQDKLNHADINLMEINSILLKRHAGVYLIKHGRFTFIKSKIINPLFRKFSIKTKKFYATDACNTCMLCEEICPVHTIKVSKKPSWGKECTQCLACLNRCPEHAIQYGKNTEKRGRYVNPDLRK